MNIAAYSTQAKITAYISPTIAMTADNATLTAILQASREIDRITNRWFYPRIETRTYDMPDGDELLLDGDLLELTTLTNGDGSTIPSSGYKLLPANWQIKSSLVLSYLYPWYPDPVWGAVQVIKVTGFFGYHTDYASAWVDSTSTLNGAVNSTTLTTIPISNSGSTVEAGQLLKVDSEFLYVSSATTTQMVVIRGVNGSTAATHLTGASLYYWSVEPEIDMLTRRAVAGFNKVRGNPLGETVQTDGITFNTPKDVTQFLNTELKRLGLVRVL